MVSFDAVTMDTYCTGLRLPYPGIVCRNLWSLFIRCLSVHSQFTVNRLETPFYIWFKSCTQIISPWYLDFLLILVLNISDYHIVIESMMWICFYTDTFVCYFCAYFPAALTIDLSVLVWRIMCTVVNIFILLVAEWFRWLKLSVNNWFWHLSCLMCTLVKSILV